MIQRMPDEEYFKMPGVSNSLLSRLAKCPANMLIEFEPSPAMLLGTLAHCLILEGREEFEKRFIVSPDCDKRTKEGKAVYQSFCEANEGKTVITLDQLQAVAGMAASVASHPAACELLQDGQPEQAITWEEGVNGITVPAKAKADWLSPTALIDLKTCQDSSYSMFSKTIFNSRYTQQFGYYKRGLAANGVYPSKFIIISVESKSPFAVNVYELSDEVLDFGEGQSLELLNLYVKVKDLDVLPAYTNPGISTIRLPAWLKELEF